MTEQQAAFEIAQDKSGAAVFAWFFGAAAFWVCVAVWACN